MNTENLSTLKIHKLSQAQYNRELAAGNIDETALYLTPDDGSDWSQNDETSSGYIKNRTHYEQVMMEEISPTFSWEANSYIDGMVAIADIGIYEFSDMPTHYDITMFDKTYYNIKFGDVVKNTSGPSFNFMLKVDYAGTGYAITAYSSVSSGFYGTSDVSITNIKKLVQLSDGYIPNTIARKTDLYTHPNSGVTAGTYNSVTVDAQGHVTAGKQYNPCPVNLLDNSDFRIAQAGYGGSHGGVVYVADRWFAHENYIPSAVSSYGGANIGRIYGLNITVDSALGMASIRQKTIVSGLSKTYTFAAHIKGTTYVVSGTGEQETSYSSMDGNIQIALGPSAEGNSAMVVRIDCKTSGTILWAALYEGEYTIDTIPPYQPKGYAAELAECQRYYQRLGSLTGVNYGGFGLITSSSNKAVRITTMCKPMRLSPVPFTITGSVALDGATGTSVNNVITTTSGKAYTNNMGLFMDIAVTDTPTGGAQFLRLPPNTFIDFNADL